MSAAAVQPGAIRKVHSSPKAKAGGLQILGAAAKEAGGDDKAPKASGAGAGKPPPPGARPKKPKPKAAAAAGDQPASTQAEPGWKAKQAAKNRAAAAGDEGGGSGAGSSRQHVEPLRTTNRARALPSFGTHGKAPAPMYSSPWLPSSYSSTTDPRATAPPALESHSPLHRQVLESWVASQPRPATLEARKAALDKVARAVSRFEGSYQLALFGSVANGVDNDASDLDICVIDDSRPRGYDSSLDANKGRKGIFNMYLLGDKLQMHGLSNILAIPQSNTPIVKCKDPDSGIELDLNVNDRGGVYNTNLIESYCYLSPYALRPLLNAVKRWGKARAVASQATSQPTFSSYALNLLCISYMLCTQPPGRDDGLPYLPNLQNRDLIATYNVPPSSIDIRVTKRDRVATVVDTTFVPVHQHDEGGANGGAWGMTGDEIAFWQARNADVDLGELVSGFFQFYAGVDGRSWSWEQDGASILDGGRVRLGRHAGRKGFEVAPLESEADEPSGLPRLQPSLAKAWAQCAMVVQDPFITSKNCAKPINVGTADEIEEEFLRAAEQLDLDDTASLARLCEPYLGPSLRSRKQQDSNAQQPRAGKRMKPAGKKGGGPPPRRD